MRHYTLAGFVFLCGMTCILWAGHVYSAAQTTNLALNKPTPGEAGWDVDLNANADILDARWSKALASYTTGSLLFWNASDQLEEDATDLRYDATKNIVSVGSGAVTTEAWHANYAAVKIGGQGSIFSDKTAGAGKEFGISQNAYYSGYPTFKRTAADEAFQIYSSSGTAVFRHAATGAADSDITWSNSLTLELTGTSTEVAIGHDNPTAQLDVEGGSGRAIIEADGDTGGCLKIQDTDNGGFTFCLALNGTLSCSSSAC